MQIDKAKYKQLSLKIFSLILAIVFWVYINGIVYRTGGGPPAYKDFKDIEIRLLGGNVFLGKNVFTVELGDTTVDLRVKGPEHDIAQLTQMDIAAYVDITGLKPGKAYSPVVSFMLPPNIEVVGAPPLVRVEIREKNLR